MACMTGDQNLLRRMPSQITLSVRQAPIFEAGVDAYLVVAVLKRQHLVMGKTKPPLFLVVRRSVRDPIGMRRNREQVRPDIAQRHGCMHRKAVIHHVQVALLKVDNAPSIRRLDKGISNVPLFGHGPVEDWRPRWYMEDLQRYPIL